VPMYPGGYPETNCRSCEVLNRSQSRIYQILQYVYTNNNRRTYLRFSLIH